ncbi:complement factor H-related protein 2 isoform X1 [Varanus komodoensis]|uniref:complement factor H-related protein 2 isoform X1 n=1 Tax=Varanus komodoensis TaxID=61221 RepID=UPI001CF7E784|nr:complement factor H-related protein 2 isoform X1 [Varanus komodoensis]
MKGMLFCIIQCFLWTYCSSQHDRGRRCGHAPVIQNGDFLEIPLNNYESGSVLTFKCQQSYIMRGSPVVRCINGNWTETPVCVEPCTIAEEDMKHNKIHLKWRDENKLYARSGEFVEFVCMFGYQPDPSSLPFRQQCIEGQLKYPKCVLSNINDCPATEEQMNSNNIQFKRTSTRTTIVRSGDMVEFVCKSGYHPDPSSPPFRQPCAEGQLEYPKCVSDHINDCQVTDVDIHPNNIEFKWRLTQRIHVKSGQAVEFVCKLGYEADPSSPPFRQHCVEGKLEYPKCILNSVNDCPATEVAMRPNNIEFRWTTTREINVRAGQFVEFICKAGYSPDPTSLPFRQRCVEGKLEYPRCM